MKCKTAADVLLDSHVYLSGPISGYADNNSVAFALAENFVLLCGAVSVFNPTESPSGETRESYMRRDLLVLLDPQKVDVVVFLPGWWASKGARLEYNIACECGIKRVFLPNLHTVVSPVDTRTSHRGDNSIQINVVKE